MHIYIYIHTYYILIYTVHMSYLFSVAGNPALVKVAMTCQSKRGRRNWKLCGGNKTIKSCEIPFHASFLLSLWSVVNTKIHCGGSSPGSPPPSLSCSVSSFHTLPFYHKGNLTNKSTYVQLINYIAELRREVLSFAGQAIVIAVCLWWRTLIWKSRKWRKRFPPLAESSFIFGVHFFGEASFFAAQWHWYMPQSILVHEKSLLLASRVAGALLWEIAGQKGADFNTRENTISHLSQSFLYPFDIFLLIQTIPTKHCEIYGLARLQVVHPMVSKSPVDWGCCTKIFRNAALEHASATWTRREYLALLEGWRAVCRLVFLGESWHFDASWQFYSFFGLLIDLASFFRYL